jgi:hypothetical protein
MGVDSPWVGETGKGVEGSGFEEPQPPNKRESSKAIEIQKNFMVINSCLILTYRLLCEF